MPRILITGASGTIGRHLVRILQSRGIEFTAMTSQAGQSIAGVPTVFGDFARSETLTEAFRGVETLFLLLPLHPETAQFGRNAIAAAKAAGVRHVVRSSGAGADADSPVAIARLHGEIDRLLEQSGLGWTLIRPTSFMQNHLTYNLQAIRSGVYHAPHGNGATSLIDVEDIAECAAAILANPGAHHGRVYTLTGGEALDDAAQMAAIAAATGRPVDYVDIPEGAAAEAMRGYGMPPAVVEWLMSLNAVVKAGYTASITDDVRHLTGHPPRRYADFVRTSAAVWRIE